tara:strand:- start:108625 stop:109056 length:432 start_codon:yes stop_codon:yes gene_type:complete
MATDPTNFATRLGATLGNTAQSAPYLEAFRTLRETADELGNWLTGGSANSDLKVDVEPGFPSRLGQQLNVVLRIPGHKVQDTLFRAYVPPTGVPISLDFYGEQPVSSGNPQELQDRVLEFLAEPEVTSRINMYKELISGDTAT